MPPPNYDPIFFGIATIAVGFRLCVSCVQRLGAVAYGGMWWYRAGAFLKAVGSAETPGRGHRLGVSRLAGLLVRGRVSHGWGGGLVKWKP